jgi:hypothetical protein
VTDFGMFCRYSEILDYHNVDTANSEGMDGFAANGH